MHIQYNTIPYSKLCLVYDKCSPMKEDPSIRGTSHLLEHLLCHHYAHLRDDLQAGDIDEEAHTSSENMVIQFSGLSKNLEPLAEALGKSILHGKPLDKESFEKEKKTVCQEIGMKFVQPIPAAVHHMLQDAFGFYGSIGEVDGVNRFTYEDYLRNCEEVFNKPWILSIGPNPILESDSHEELYPNKFPLIEKICANNSFVKETSRDQKVIFIVTNNPCRDADEALLLKSAIAVLSEGLQSPFMQELREKRGLVYVTGGTFLEMGGRLPIFLSMSDKPNEVLKLMQDLLLDVRNNVTDERIAIIRKQITAQEEQKELFRYRTSRRVINEHAGYTVASKNFDIINKEGIVGIIEKYFGEGKYFTYIE